MVITCILLFKVLLNELDEPCTALPKPEFIARAANRLCQKLRLDDPNNLDFDLEEDSVPEGFLQADIRVKDRRHFAKDEQLYILCRAKTWYVDGTFKLVCHPFKQLLTINAFVRSGHHVKQVPLMSGRKEKDYKKVRIKSLSVLFNKKMF